MPRDKIREKLRGLKFDQVMKKAGSGKTREENKIIVRHAMHIAILEECAPGVILYILLTNGATGYFGVYQSRKPPDIFKVYTNNRLHEINLADVRTLKMIMPMEIVDALNGILGLG